VALVASPISDYFGMKISIIVPVLNEAEHIVHTLMPLRQYRNQGHEVIVIDGGSDDESIAVAEPYVDRVLRGEKGRASQMNHGIEAAQGDVLLFLHADTRLPVDSAAKVINAIEDGYFWGRFNVRLSGDRFLYRIIERMMNLRSCITGVATGDQAIFVSRESIQIVGDYPGLPLMEDVVFSKRLRSLGWPACVKSRVITSSRRWEDNGILPTLLLMWRLRLLFFLGVPAEKLAKQYR